MNRRYIPLAAVAAVAAVIAGSVWVGAQLAGHRRAAHLAAWPSPPGDVHSARGIVPIIERMISDRAALIH